MPTFSTPTIAAMLNSDATVVVECIDCSLSTEYDNGSAFRAAGGEIYHTDPCLIKCPGCEQACWSTIEPSQRENRITFETTDNIDSYPAVYDSTTIVAACHHCRELTTVGNYNTSGGRFDEAHLLHDGVALPCSGCGILRRMRSGYSTGSDAMFVGLHDSVSLDCPHCDGTRTLERTEGPDVPELGWRYYVCLVCSEPVARGEIE